MLALVFVLPLAPSAAAGHDEGYGITPFFFGSHPLPGYTPFQECHGTAPDERGCAGSFTARSTYFWLSSCDRTIESCSASDGTVVVTFTGSSSGRAVYTCYFTLGVYEGCARSGSSTVFGSVISYTVDVHGYEWATPVGGVPMPTAPSGSWNFWLTNA